MKCEKCGRGVGLVRRGLRCSDGKYLCFECARDLGLDPGKDWKQSYYLYSYEDIKDGLDAYNQRRWDAAAKREADSLGILLPHYRQLKKALATDLEMKLFSAMCAIWEDDGLDVARLVISPGERGSLLVLLDDVVVLEYKGEPQVRWIRFSGSEEKIRIGNSARINSLASCLIDSFRSAE